MKRKMPLPKNLKNVPKSYVYLGKGGEFKVPNNSIKYKCLYKCASEYDKEFYGNEKMAYMHSIGSIFYAFPKNSATVKLNAGNSQNTNKKSITGLMEEVRVLKEKIKKWEDWAERLKEFVDFYPSKV